MVIQTMTDTITVSMKDANIVRVVALASDGGKTNMVTSIGKTCCTVTLQDVTKKEKMPSHGADSSETMS